MQQRKTNHNVQIGFWGLWGSLTFFGGLFVLMTNLGVTSAMIAGGFLILMGLLLLYVAVHISKSPIKPVYTCRNCGKQGLMAITYGDDEGLCQECLEEIVKIPGVLKDGREKAE